MGSTTAFVCDASDCNEMIIREKGDRTPEPWLRITLHVPTGAGDEKFTGAFHDVQCLHAWIAERAGQEDDGRTA